MHLCNRPVWACMVTAGSPAIAGLAALATATQVSASAQSQAVTREKVIHE